MSGIWPLFSRLQSKSSPEQAQGGGHVRALAADPRCSLRNTTRNTANPARVRGCGEERIFSGHTGEQPSLAGAICTRSATNPKSDKSPTRKRKEKNPKSGAVYQRSRSLYPIPCRSAARGCETEKKSGLLKLAHSCGETFRCCCCCWGNLCCAGSPQRSVSAQQRYAGGGTTGAAGRCSPPC